MINVQALQQASNDLNSIDNKKVVKVAGIIERLRAWYHQLLNPQYRAQLQKLHSDSAVIKIFLNELSKYIEMVNTAISNGDIDNYNYALEQVKVISRDLAKELEEYSQEADKAAAPTEDKTPSMDRIESVYFTDKMRSLPRLHNFIAAAFVQAGSSREEALQIAAQPELYDAMEQAIQHGRIIGSRIARTSKGREERVGELWVDIQTPPFMVPNYPISMQMVAEVTDLSSRTSSPIPRMAVKWIKKIQARRIGAQKTAAQVRADVTFVNQLDFARLIIEALKSIGIKNINAQLVGSIWAQAIQESGRKGRTGPIILRNNNIGGITAGNYDKWNEGGWLKNDRPYVLGKPLDNGKRLKFKAFSTPLEGVKEYIKTLMHLYPQSILWKMSGLPLHDAAYLKTKNYYGNVPIMDYGGGMDSMFKEFMERIYPSLKNELPNDPKPPPDDLTKYDLPNANSSKYGWAAQSKPKYELDELSSYLGINLAMNNIINKAISDNLFPTNVIKLSVKSNDNYSDKIEYAYILSNALERTLDVDVSIHSDGQNIELNCEDRVSKSSLMSSALGVADIVSLAFNKKYNTEIKSMPSGTRSVFSKLSETNLDIERRKFTLKRLGNV